MATVGGESPIAMRTMGVPAVGTPRTGAVLSGAGGRVGLAGPAGDGAALPPLSVIGRRHQDDSSLGTHADGQGHVCGLIRIHLQVLGPEPHHSSEIERIPHAEVSTVLWVVGCPNTPAKKRVPPMAPTTTMR